MQPRRRSSRKPYAGTTGRPGTILCIVDNRLSFLLLGNQRNYLSVTLKRWFLSYGCAGRHGQFVVDRAEERFRIVSLFAIFIVVYSERLFDDESVLLSAFKGVLGGSTGPPH